MFLMPSADKQKAYCTYRARDGSQAYAYTFCTLKRSDAPMTISLVSPRFPTTSSLSPKPVTS
ncbi:hypothetical protein JMJ77_0002212 [Colletotrichum scovillei]|uniref:Uncharacterized protein n=1 Tax=Colletotrichum scovillei TaxID=1209932 RepID=A0A9P7R9X3_9PEZI|nr:hypothetical protein JMJ77_0002212 [Colletotrichum scovillei]KAG7070630.1 hypothetical protein JMJ76_0001877 [Colletotrichum scovillei]KAG7078873.1 hypothetical protein JMJ78_0002536 [Colletotrichum scovillei]